ncbi:MAG: tRNA threonylcarbamoyladenosine dehydratase [Alphaproteobacteria bacterium]|nr:tRNA threonylcarbamoyladenosine dehydratase [Alphaproteobacteria bacterium]
MRLMVGESALKKLEKSHICVVGCGAVGGYVLESLARAGIKHLTLIDFDTISITNINRQLLALNSTIGQKKVDVARQRIADISNDIRVDTLDILINQETVSKIIEIKPDFVVDAIDSLNPKVCLIETLVKNNIPFVSCMGAALKTKANLIQVEKMKNTRNDPLAGFIRKYLRRRGVPLDFKVVYSPELTKDKSKLAMPESAPEKGRVRHQMGSLPTITGIFGLTCAQVALDYLIQCED